jgi:flagellar hook-associated protein 1 FlgK
LQDFFSGVQAVANDPASIPARQSLLSDTQTLTARFSALSDRLQQIRSGVNTQLTSTVTEINAFSTQIADINQKIVIAQSANQQPPNDLLDQRDQLVAQLNEQVKATVVKQSDGTYNIFVGNGQPLVVGASAYGLGTAQSPEDPDTLNVVYQTAGGGQIPLNQSDLSGGNLGGLLAFRTDVLDKAQNELGRVALTLAETVNNQHQLGQDLNGALGGAFFNIASTSPTVQANTNNSGAGVLSATLDTTNAGAATLTTSNYRLTYNAGNYTVLDLTNNTSTTVAAAALSTAIPGVNLSMAGLPNNGDSFLVLPTRNGARDISLAINDVSQIAAAAPIRTAAGTANTGTASINAGSVDNTTQPPLNANLQQPVTITFTSATTFDVTGTGTGNPVGVAYTPGGNISYNGWVVQISGTPAAGDAFTIAPNTGGVADGRNALAIGTLQTTNLLAGNTTTYQGAYSQLVSEVGNKTRETQLSSQAQGALLSQTQQSQQSLSGVNLDEEAANLMRYQQAYQAVAKVIQTAGTLFDTILNLR